MLPPPLDATHAVNMSLKIDKRENATIMVREVSELLVFNTQPTSTVISRRYTLQSLLKNKTWLVKRMWFLIQLKWLSENGNGKKNNKKTLCGYHINKTPKIWCTIAEGNFSRTGVK